MKTDSRSFESRRYKALYYLLPLFNGAVIAAGHYALRRITGGPLLDTGLSAGVTGILTDFVYFAAALVLPGLVICSFEILALGWIYRRNVLPFAVRRLRGGEGVNTMSMGPVFLTFAGAIVVVTVLRLSSIWTPVTSGISSTGILLGAAFLYVVAVLPVLAHCEQAAEGTNDSVAGGSA